MDYYFYYKQFQICQTTDRNRHRQIYVNLDSVFAISLHRQKPQPIQPTLNSEAQQMIQCATAINGYR